MFTCVLGQYVVSAVLLDVFFYFNFIIIIILGGRASGLRTCLDSMLLPQSC